MAELPECIKTFKSRIRGFFGLSSGPPKRVQQPRDVETSSSVDKPTTDEKTLKQEKPTAEVNGKKKTPPKKKPKVRTGYFQLKPPLSSDQKSSLKVPEGSIAVSIRQKPAKKQGATVKVVREKAGATLNTEKVKPSANINNCVPNTTAKEHHLLSNKSRIQDGVEPGPRVFSGTETTTTKLVESRHTQRDQNVKVNVHGGQHCSNKGDSIVTERVTVKSECDAVEPVKPVKPVNSTNTRQTKHPPNTRATDETTGNPSICGTDIRVATKVAAEQAIQPTFKGGEQKTQHTEEFAGKTSNVIITDQPCGAVKPRESVRPIEDQLRDLVKHIKDHKRGTMKPTEDQLRGTLKPSTDPQSGTTKPIGDHLHGIDKPNKTSGANYVKQAYRQQMGTGKTLNTSDHKYGTDVNLIPEKQTGVVKDAKLRADGTFKEVTVNGIGPTRTTANPKAQATSKFFSRVVTKGGPLKTQIPVSLTRKEDSNAKHINTGGTVVKPGMVKGLSRATILSPAPNVRNAAGCVSRINKGIQCELETFTCVCSVLDNGQTVLCKHCFVSVQSANDKILTSKSRAINWRSGMTLENHFANADNRAGKLITSKVEVVTRSVSIQTVRHGVQSDVLFSAPLSVDGSRPCPKDVTIETNTTVPEQFSAPFPNFQFQGNTFGSSPSSNKSPSWKTVERKQKTAKRRVNTVPDLRRTVCGHVWNPVDYTQGIQWEGCGTTPVNTPGFVPTIVLGKTPTTKAAPNYVGREVRAAIKPKCKEAIVEQDVNKKESTEPQDKKDKGIKLPVVEIGPHLKTANRNLMDTTQRDVKKTVCPAATKTKVAEKTPVKKVDKLKKIWKQIKGKKMENVGAREVVFDTGLDEIENVIIDPMADIFLAATADDLDRIDGINREEMDLACEDNNLSTSFADFSGTCEDLLTDTFVSNVEVEKSSQQSSVSVHKVLGILLNEFGTPDDMEEIAVGQQVGSKVEAEKDETGDKALIISAVKRSRSLEDLVSLPQATGEPPVGENLNCEYENPFEISGSIRIDDHYEPGKKAGRGHIAEVRVKHKRRGEANKHLQNHGENSSFREKGVRFMDGNNDGDPGSHPMPIQRGFEEKTEHVPDAECRPDEVTKVEPLEHVDIDDLKPTEGTSENTNCPQPLPEADPDMRHCREIPLEVIYRKKGVEEEENRYSGPRGIKKKKGRQRGRDGPPKGRPPPLLGIVFDI